MPASHKILAACLALGAPLAPSVAWPDARERVLAHFDESQLVFLGERHWSRQDSEFRLALVEHPRFAERVDDVVVEFANSRYQDLLDAYFLDLAEVEDAELSQVWRNTTQIRVWDSPVYERFFRAVRSLNEGLPRERRVRVVAAGVPIDWSAVEVWEDKLPYRGYRGWWAVRRIEREVLAKGRKGLVITGRGNVQRRDDEMDEEDNEIRRLDALYPGKSFAVVVPGAPAEPGVPDLVELAGGEPLPVYVDLRAEPFAGRAAVGYLPGAAGTLGEVADGLLYFGREPDERVRPPEALYERGSEYRRELERRRGLKRRLPPKSYN